MPKSTAFSYKPRFAVIVICKDEHDAEARYNELKKRGLRVRVVSV